MIQLGIDHGNYATKSSDGMAYSSGYTVSTQPPIGSAGDCLHYGGRYYSIGAARPPVRHDKTLDEDTFILTLPALARAIDAHGDCRDAVFTLGVGLPLMAYSEQRDRFRAYFLGRGPVDYKYNGKAYRANIADAAVYPQGYAAYLTQYQALSGYQDVAHIDIGGYTVDIFKTHDGRLVEGSATSIPGGTITLAKRIGAELLRYDIRISDDQIMDAIAGRSINHKQAARISAAAAELTAAYARDINNILREYGIDTQAPINLIGGGAALLRHRLTDMYIVGHADQYANARGYLQWLARD